MHALLPAACIPGCWPSATQPLLALMADFLHAAVTMDEMEGTINKSQLAVQVEHVLLDHTLTHWATACYAIYLMLWQPFPPPHNLALAQPPPQGQEALPPQNDLHHQDMPMENWSNSNHQLNNYVKTVQSPTYSLSSQSPWIHNGSLTTLKILLLTDWFLPKSDFSILAFLQLTLLFSFVSSSVDPRKTDMCLLT